MWEETQVLVVDDTPTNLEVVTEVLSTAGYDVAIAMSGERALKQLKYQSPSLILLDVQMPGIDGFETCRRLKEDSRTSQIPVIFLTAFSDTESIIKGFSLGAVDYISKPFQEEVLLARVQTHLRLSTLNQVLEQQVAERTVQLKQALDNLHKAQLEIIQSEKMSSLGNLIAGIAHEINNPLGFLKGSIKNSEEYIQDLSSHLSLYQAHYPQPVPSIQDHAEEIDLEFLNQDLPTLLNSMDAAADRIHSISVSLRTFSRADTEYKVDADVHEGLDSTLLLLKYRLKADEHRPEIQVQKQYGELPEVQCFPGQLNQVFMNILANAIDIFDEVAQQTTFAHLKTHPQVLTIYTVLVEPDWIEIRIKDNGRGMTEDVKAKIFEHLFTTKGVGKGTGLGLAIAHQIVVEAHGGRLTVQSELGQGSEFCIQLPIHSDL